LEPLRSTGRPAPLWSVLGVTFLGSVSGGAFWAGIFFVTASHYHFAPSRNLALAASMGITYALCARFTGPGLRALERHLSPRSILIGTLAVWGLVSLVPLLDRHSELLIWLTGIGGGAASAVTWPVVESYMGAGRHGAGMRTAIGWFNLVWTPATALPLLVMPLVARADPLYTLALSALCNAGAVLLCLFLPARPAPAGAEAASAVGREYPFLLRAASLLLPLSYVMSSTLSPVLPHRLAALGSAVPASVLAATWMLTRFAALFVMWRVGFWHGRWGTLVAGAASLAGGLALVLVAPSLSMVMVGLALFGAGMALTYYAALYYALAVGHGAVDAGGNFEALIGLGYGLGPILGLAGQLVGGGSGPRAGTATVAFTWLVSAAASALALGVYLRARRARPIR
jgi:hypothetical protein